MFGIRLLSPDQDFLHKHYKYTLESRKLRKRLYSKDAKGPVLVKTKKKKK